MDREREREERARRRREVAQVRVCSTEDAATDPWPVVGAAAVELASRLSLSAWAVSGAPMPRYDRTDIPVRLIRRDRAS